MKKQLYLLLIITSLLISPNAFAIEPKELKQPQGRMGVTYKPENYSSSLKTNISKQELENLVKINKENETNNQKVKLLAIKEQQEKQKLLAKQQKENQKQQEKAELLAIKEQQEKQKLLAKQQKENQKQQEKAELLAIKEQQEKQKLLAKQQKEEIIDKNEAKRNFFMKKTEVTNATNNVKPAKDETKQAIQNTIAEEKIKQSIATPKHNQNPETVAIVNEINKELYEEKQKMLEELSILWVNAVQKSDTVYFAIMKLSNPNGEEVNKKGYKKILEPIINAAPLVGQAFVNPAITAGSLIGSNVMGTMMNNNADKRLTKVNDADLVILARAIDELQEKLLLNYMAYKSTLKEYQLAIKIADERKKTYDKMNKTNSHNVILANTFYTEAMDNQYKARQEFLMKRVILEQMVGSEAINEIEKTIEGITNNENYCLR